jgi:hypothetical protein
MCFFHYWHIFWLLAKMEKFRFYENYLSGPCIPCSGRDHGYLAHIRRKDIGDSKFIP